MHKAHREGERYATIQREQSDVRRPARLVHAMDNVSWSLFPNYGSGIDPFVTGIVTVITAVIVTMSEEDNYAIAL